MTPYAAEGAGIEREKNIHIDGSKTTVGDRAADGTGKGESGVQGHAGELGRLGGLDILDDGIDLGRASGFCVGGHCD